MYQAIVWGHPSWEKQDLIAPIDVDPNASVRLRRKVLEGGQHCHTTFQVVQRLQQHTLIECHLHTGRTHQIRVHMEHLGHPLLGDKLYGQPDDVFIEYLDHGVTPTICQAIQFPRHCLHSASIGFPHPDGGYKRIHAPLPEDMQRVVSGEEPRWDFPKAP